MPIGIELAAANTPERDDAAKILERVPVAGHTVLSEQGFAGERFEPLKAGHGARFLRPERQDEPRRFGSLGAIRPCTESAF